MRLLLALLPFAGALVTLPATADPIATMLFQHKHWEVEHVLFDDGTTACYAEVDATSDSFTVWGYPNGDLKLQFYSTSWDFGESGDTADIQLQIGNESPWNLNSADLYKNSILFNLPDSNDSVRFLTEVAGGNRLYLRSGNGDPVMDYSLAGSRAAMGAMINCVEQL